jgi:hypothetical protein
MPRELIRASSQGQIDVGDHLVLADIQSDIDVVKEDGIVAPGLAARGKPLVDEERRGGDVLPRAQVTDHGAAATRKDLVDHALRIGRDRPVEGHTDVHAMVRGRRRARIGVVDAVRPMAIWRHAVRDPPLDELPRRVVFTVRAASMLDRGDWRLRKLHNLHVMSDCLLLLFWR